MGAGASAAFIGADAPSKASADNFNDKPRDTGAIREHRQSSIFVMDPSHQQEIQQRFGGYNDHVQVGLLNVPQQRRYPYIDFRFEKKIGTGRFSTIYKAVSLKENGIKVAVKEVKVAGMSRQQIADFRYELNVLSQLQHKHISRLASVYDPSSNNSIIYVVMEYLKGGELIPAICRQKEYFESDAKRFIRQLCSAMQHMHRHGVIHGNLVPENLVLTKASFRSNLRVVDFGNAEAEYHRRQGGVGSGGGIRRLITEDFRAPELDQPSRSSYASDVWAVGVITHLIISGILPFETNEIQPLHQVRSFTEVSWDDVSPDAIDFIFKVLTIDAKVRPKVDDLLKHPWLEQYIGEQAIEKMQKVDPSVLEQVELESRKHDISLNLLTIRAYQERHTAIQVLTVSSGAITFFKLGRYLCEQNLAILTGVSLLDVDLTGSGEGMKASLHQLTFLSTRTNFFSLCIEFAGYGNIRYFSRSFHTPRFTRN